MLFSITGPPGSGKKEAATKIATQKGYVHLSAGELLRAQADNDTDEGRKLAEEIAAGGLAHWDMMVLLSLEIDAKQDAKGFVIDGFPRTKEQAEGFADMVRIIFNLRQTICYRFGLCIMYTY